MARPEGSKEELEARRKQAVRLLERTDMSVSEVAEVEGVTRQAVNNWKNRYEDEGMEGLEAKPSSGGRSTALPEEKFPELEQLLGEGAQAHGFEGDLWTLPRVARLIEEEFDVDVTPRTAGNYLDRLDWSNQRPQRRAAERDPEQIEQWRDEWEYRQKKADRCDETIAFVDESGFQLTPTFHRTWAPAGETPHIETISNTDPVSVISAVTYTPATDEYELFFRSQQGYFDGDSIFAFLRDVAEFLPRDVMFILDRLPAHFPAVEQLKEAFAEAETDVAAEWLPTYAPELNPTEFVWRESKYVDLANYAPKNLDILQRRVGQSLLAKQDHQSFLRSCFEFADLEISV